MAKQKRKGFTLKYFFMSLVLSVLVLGVFVAGATLGAEKSYADDGSSNFVLGFNGVQPNFAISSFDFNGDLTYDGYLTEDGQTVTETGLSDLLCLSGGYHQYFTNFNGVDNLSEEQKEQYKNGFLKFDLTLIKKVGKIYSAPFSTYYFSKMEIYTASAGSVEFGRFTSKSWTFSDGKVVDDGTVIDNNICSIDYELNEDTGDLSNFVIRRGRDAKNIRIKLVFFVSERSETRSVEMVNKDAGVSLSSNLVNFNTCQEVMDGGASLMVDATFSDGQFLKCFNYSVMINGEKVKLFSVYGGIAVNSGNNDLKYYYSDDAEWIKYSDYFETNGLGYRDFSYSAYAYRVVYPQDVTLEESAVVASDSSGKYVGSSIKLSSGSLFDADYFVKFYFLVSGSGEPVFRFEKSNLTKSVFVDASSVSYFYVTLNEVVVGEADDETFQRVNPYGEIFLSDESGSLVSENLVKMGQAGVDSGIYSFKFSSVVGQDDINYVYKNGSYEYSEKTTETILNPNFVGEGVVNPDTGIEEPEYIEVEKQVTKYKNGPIVLFGIGMNYTPYVNVTTSAGYTFDSVADGLVSTTKFKAQVFGRRDLYASRGDEERKYIFEINIRLLHYNEEKMGLDAGDNITNTDNDSSLQFQFVYGNTQILNNNKLNINSKNGSAKYTYTKLASELVDGKFATDFTIKPSYGFFVVGERRKASDGTFYLDRDNFAGEQSVNVFKQVVIDTADAKDGQTKFTLDIVYYVSPMEIIFNVTDPRLDGAKIGELKMAVELLDNIKLGVVGSVGLYYKPEPRDGAESSEFEKLYYDVNGQNSNLPNKRGYTFNGLSCFAAVGDGRDRVFVYRTGLQFGYTDKVLINSDGVVLETGEASGALFSFISNLFGFNGYHNGHGGKDVSAMFTANTYRINIHNDFGKSEEEVVLSEIVFDTNILKLERMLDIPFGYQSDFLACRVDGVLDSSSSYQNCFKIGTFVNENGKLVEKDFDMSQDADGNWQYTLFDIWKDAGEITDLYLYLTSKVGAVTVKSGIFEEDTNYWLGLTNLTEIMLNIPYDADFLIGDVINAYFLGGEVNFLYSGSSASIVGEDIVIDYLGKRAVLNSYSAKGVLPENPSLGRTDGIFSYLRGHEFYGYILADSSVNYQKFEDIVLASEIITDLGGSDTSQKINFSLPSGAEELLLTFVPVFSRGQYTFTINANTGVYDRETGNDVFMVPYDGEEMFFEFRSNFPENILTRLLVPVAPIGKTFVGYSIRADLRKQGSEKTADGTKMVEGDDELIKVFDYDFSSGKFTYVGSNGDKVNIENFVYVGGDRYLVDLITDTIFYATYIDTPFKITLNIFDEESNLVSNTFVSRMETDILTYEIGADEKPVLDENGNNKFVNKLTESGNTIGTFGDFKTSIPNGLGGIVYASDKIVIKNFKSLIKGADAPISEGANIYSIELCYKDSGGAINIIKEYPFMFDSSGSIRYGRNEEDYGYIYNIEADELTLVVKDGVNLAYETFPGIVFEDFVINIKYSYAQYVVGFSAGVYVFEQSDFVLKTAQETVYYSVNYKTKDDFTTWLRCDANGVIDTEAPRLTTTTENFVEVVVAGQKVVFGVDSLLKTDQDVNSVVVGGKSYFFAHWARRGVDASGNIFEEELETNGEDSVQLCGNDGSGNMTYYTVFIDSAEINVKYYTWNGLAGLGGQAAYGVSGHYGYFWKNSDTIKHTLKNAYELYKFDNYYMFISGWLLVYDEKANMASPSNFSSIAGYDETYYATVLAGSNYLVLDNYAVNFIYPDVADTPYYYKVNDGTYTRLITGADGLPAMTFDRNDGGENAGYYRNVSFYAIYTVYRLDAIGYDADGNEFVNDGEDTELASIRIETRVPNDILGNSYSAADLIWFKADKKRYDTFSKNSNYSNADLINNKDYMDADLISKNDPNFAGADQISVAYLTGTNTPLSPAKELLLVGIKRKYNGENTNENNYVYFAIPVGYYREIKVGGSTVIGFARYSDTSGADDPTPLPSDLFTGVFDSVPELSRIVSYTDGQSEYATAYQSAVAELNDFKNNGVIDNVEFKKRELAIRYAAQLLEWHRIVVEKHFVDNALVLGANTEIAEKATYSNNKKATFSGATSPVGMIYEYELHFYGLGEGYEKSVAVDTYENSASIGYEVTIPESKKSLDFNNLLSVISQVKTDDNKLNYSGVIFTDCFGYIRICYSLAAYTINKNNPAAESGLNKLYGHSGGYGGHNTFKNGLSTVLIPGDMLVIQGPSVNGSASGYHVLLYTNKSNGGATITALECVRQYDRVVSASFKSDGAPNYSDIKYYYQYPRAWGNNGQRAITHYSGQYWGR